MKDEEAISEITEWIKHDGVGKISVVSLSLAIDALREKQERENPQPLTLAAYEDTGLTPEEIAHAKDLLAAEKDGRLVTLPCKVGDTVYLTMHGYVEETKVRTLFFGHPSYSGGAPDPNYYRIRCENLDLRWDAIGKTVFLTRAEAEKALGKEQA